MKINYDAVYSISDNVVAREIEEELIIVPLVSGIGDLDDEIFTMNATGKAIWNLLDGKNSIQNIIEILKNDYDSPQDEIEEDVMGLVEELVNQGMLVEQTKV